jgi:WD40 repeat protein
MEIYDVKSQSMKKKTWKIQSSTCVNCICYSKNDRYIAIGNSNGSINLFNTLTNTMGKQWVYNSKLSPAASSVTAIQFSAKNPPSGLCAAYEDGTAIFWDVSKETPECVFKSHNAPCTSIVLSPLSFILMVSGGLDSIFTMYDINSKK